MPRKILVLLATLFLPGARPVPTISAKTAERYVWQALRERWANALPLLSRGVQLQLYVADKDPAEARSWALVGVSPRSAMRVLGGGTIDVRKTTRAPKGVARVTVTEGAA